MITALVSRLIILVFGTLYPAYASYKAVRTKDVREYVKWMMYWVVFALFTCVETITDVLLSFWFPFYYEIKVALVFWLLSPATKGSSFLYRNFVHTSLQKRESEIDEMIARTKERGYNTVLTLGSKGVTYATNVILQTAMKGGGGLMEQLIKRSYSLTDLPQKPQTATDVQDGAQRQTRPAMRGRRVVGSSVNLNMRFPEVDVDVRANPGNQDIIGDIRSSEDISSGYSSTDQLYTEGMLTRSSSVTSAKIRGGRGIRTTQIRRAPLSEDTEDSDDEYQSALAILPYPKPYSSNASFSANLYRLRSNSTDENSSKVTVHFVPSLPNSLFSTVRDPPSPSEESNAEFMVSEISDDISVSSVSSSTVENRLTVVHSEQGFLTVEKSLSQSSLTSDRSDCSSDPERKGKYNKKHAPPPPATPGTVPVQTISGSKPLGLNFPDRFTDS